MGIFRVAKSIFQGSLKSQEELINELSSGIVAAFKEPVPPAEQLRALLSTAQRDGIVASHLSAGVMIDDQAIHRQWMKIVSGNAVECSTSIPMERQIDLVLREIGFAILAKLGEPQITVALRRSLAPSDLRRLEASSQQTRASLNFTAIDRPVLMKALRHVSEAKVRLGWSVSELSKSELEARTEEV